ncbi:MAG TPA: BrnT family toxin [Terriglobales bacterium]
MKDACEFDWDEQNERHLARHGISRSDAEDIFYGNHLLIEYQVGGNEQRWIAVGATRTGRILEIVFTVRSEAIRTITGWQAEKETAELYLKEWGIE